MTFLRRHRLAVAAVLVAWVAAGVVGWVSRDTVLAANGDALTVIRGLAGWAGAASLVIAGALIGAGGAWIVARGNRNEARRSRVMDRLIAEATDFVQAGDRHCQEVAQQFTWRVEQAAAGGTPTNVPPVGSTQALRDAVNVLFVVAAPDTAELALAYYQWVIELDRFAFDPGRHVGLGRVILLPGDHGSAMGMAQLQATAAKTEFMNAVRAELGRPALLDDLDTTKHR